MCCSIAANLPDEIGVQHPSSPIISFDYSDLIFVSRQINGKGKDMNARE